MTVKVTELKLRFYEGDSWGKTLAYEDLERLCIAYCDQPDRVEGECLGRASCLACPFADDHVHDIESYIMEYKLEALDL